MLKCVEFPDETHSSTNSSVEKVEQPSQYPQAGHRAIGRCTATALIGQAQSPCKLVMHFVPLLVNSLPDLPLLMFFLISCSSQPQTLGVPFPGRY